MFLCETLSLSFKIEEIRIHLRYDCVFSVNCVGRSGGLCILWNFASLCSITSYSQNYIDMNVSSPDGNWHLTGFYSFPEVSRRKDSWDSLQTLANVSNDVWLVIGNFNNILTSNEKKGVVWPN